MRVLITGITGFVGSHMTDYLLDNVKDVQIYATRRWRSKEDNIKHLFGDDRVIFEECDLLDRGSLSRIIDISSKDVVYHLTKSFRIKFSNSKYNPNDKCDWYD